MVTWPPHSAAIAAAARPAPPTVPAAVSDLRQGVVLEADADVRSGRAGAADERGVEAVRLTDGRHPFGLERVGQEVVGEAFLEVRLGVGVDAM
jgi:hypothetical protein